MLLDAIAAGFWQRRAGLSIGRTAADRGRPGTCALDCPGGRLVRGSAAETVERIATGAASSMWISKVSHVIGSSPSSFEDAAGSVIARANRTLRGITGFDVVEKRLKVESGGIAEYRVQLRLHFDIAPHTEAHW
jgi:dodecin